MAKVNLGGHDYDSFATIVQADQYLAADVVRAAVWATRQPEAKARGLISATRLLARQTWCAGVPSFDAPGDVVIEVTAILAADALAKPKLLGNPGGASNVKVAKAGSAQVEFFAATTSTANPLPDEAWALLVAAGLVGCSGQGDDSTNDTPIVTGARGEGCDRWPYGGYFGIDDDGRTGGW